MAPCMWQAITPLLSQWLPILPKIYWGTRPESTNSFLVRIKVSLNSWMSYRLMVPNQAIITTLVQVVQESMSTYGQWNLRKHVWMKLDISKQLLVVQIMKNFDLRMFHICRWYIELNPTDLHQYIAKCNFQILMQVKASKRQWVNSLWPSDAI